MTQISNLKEQLENCSSCAELQEAQAAVMAALNAQLAGIQSQIEKLAPLLTLLELPSDPMQILTWAQKVVNSLVMPALAPYYVYQAKLIEMTTTIAEIQSMIPDLAVKFPDCNVQVNNG